MRALSKARLDTEATRPRLSAPSVCACCHVENQKPIRLERATGFGSVEVCSRCLRSSMQRQADGSQRRNRALLEDFAEENGFQIWASQNVLYVLPPTGPFAP